MNLVIRAVMLDEQPLEEPLLGVFDARGGTIGRSQANTLALPDPERRLSRLQAEVSSGAHGYVIRNAGTTSPILVNDVALAPGESGPIAHRDELRLGGYVLRVLLDGEGPSTSGAHVAVDARAVMVAAAREPRTDPRFLSERAGGMATIAPGAGLGLSKPPSGGNPFADLLAPSGSPMGSAAASSDPFADLLAPSPASAGRRAPASAAAFAPAAQSTMTASHDDPFAFIDALPAAAAAAPLPPPPRVALPDDFDPFADLGGPAPQAPADFGGPAPAAASGVPLQRASAGAPSDLLGAVGASSGRAAGLDEAFGLGNSRGGAADPLAAFMAGASSTANGIGMGADPASLPSTDPLAMFSAPASGSARASAARPAAAANHTAELQGAYSPPRIVEPVRPPAGSAATAPRPAPGGAPAVPPEAPRKPPSAQPSAAQNAAAQPAAAQPAGAQPAAAQPGTAQPGRAQPAAARPAPAQPAIAQPAAATPRPASSAPVAAAIRAPAPAPAADAAPPSVAGPQSTPAASQAPPGGILWAAFCEGAGISLPLPNGLSPDQMRLLGQLMRAAVDGTRHVLAERDVARRGAQAAPAPSPARGHNPLAMAADTPVALEQLLQPPLRGFMSGPAALQAALQDVAQHVAASAAGAKGGLAAAVACFEPAQLEAALAKSMLSLNRKTRLWEQYQQQFETVRAEAKERFRTQLASALAAPPPAPR